MKDKKPNKYLIPMTDAEKKYWDQRATWFKLGYQKHWYDRIDQGALYADLFEITGNDEIGDQVGDLIHKLVEYARIRDRVIEHRQAVVNQMRHLIDVVLRHPGPRESMMSQLTLIVNYLEQMQVTGATEIMPPSGNPWPEDKE